MKNNVVLWTIIYFFEQKAKEIWGGILEIGGFFEMLWHDFSRECREDKTSFIAVLFLELLAIFLIASFFTSAYTYVTVLAVAFFMLVAMSLIIAAIIAIVVVLAGIGLVVIGTGLLIFAFVRWIISNAKLAYKRAKQKGEENGSATV